MVNSALSHSGYNAAIKSPNLRRSWAGSIPQEDRNCSAVKNNFMCSTYKKKGKDVCSAHYIRELDLYAIVLDDLRRVTHFARQNQRRFAEYIGMKMGKEAAKEISLLQKKLDAMTRRRGELSALFKRLYEDSVLGRIPEEQYRLLSQDYMAEQKAIDEELPQLTEALQNLKDSSTNIDRFLENARKYTEIPELTAEILHTFIERIEVGERGERYCVRRRRFVSSTGTSA